MAKLLSLPGWGLGRGRTIRYPLVAKSGLTVGHNRRAGGGQRRPGACTFGAMRKLCVPGQHPNWAGAMSRAEPTAGYAPGGRHSSPVGRWVRISDFGLVASMWRVARSSTRLAPSGRPAALPCQEAGSPLAPSTCVVAVNAPAPCRSEGCGRSHSAATKVAPCASGGEPWQAPAVRTAPPGNALLAADQPGGGKTLQRALAR